MNAARLTDLEVQRCDRALRALGVMSPEERSAIGMHHFASELATRLRGRVAGRGQEPQLGAGLEAPRSALQQPAAENGRNQLATGPRRVAVAIEKARPYYMGFVPALFGLVLAGVYTTARRDDAAPWLRVACIAATSVLFGLLLPPRMLPPSGMARR